MPYLKDEDISHWDLERPRRTDRRKPKANRTRRDLLLAPNEERLTSTSEFSDPGMQSLYDRGYFDSFIGELKGGKEATVFLVGLGEQRLAAKVYTDLAVRGFRNDAVYWSDFYIGDARVKKAMQQHSRAGQKAQQEVWVLREYFHLWRLHQAGLKVPKPAVGPEVSAYGDAGAVVLMQFIGEGDLPAPRLSDIKLAADEAKEAFNQTVELLAALTRLGVVHGDLSTYNLLWHEGEVWLIDLPQMVDLKASRVGPELLGRDIKSLATSFRRLGVFAAEAVLQRAVAAARR